MASKNVRSDLSVKEQLLNKSGRFDFYSAMYLLEKLAAENHKTIKNTPNPSSAFSGASIDKIVEQDNQYQLVSNLMGLYTSSSPLPNYYLDEILTQINDNQLQTKAFLDIFHQRLYQLLFKAWEQHNLPYQLFLKENTHLEQMLYNIAGISFSHTSELLEKMPGLKKYFVHFMAGNRTLLSLQNLLSDFFGIEVMIQSYYSARVQISKAQKNVLGMRNNKLGNTCYLGESYQSMSNNVLLKIKPISKSVFDNFLPGGKMHQQLIEIVKTFSHVPLNYYLTASLAVADIQGVSLGDKKCNRLGQEAWLSKHSDMSSHSFTYQLKLNS